MSTWSNTVRRNKRKKELRLFYRRRFPDLSFSEVDLTIEQNHPNWVTLTSRDLGEEMQLTYEVRRELDIRTIDCFDKTRAETKAENYRRRAPQRALAARKRRARDRLEKAEALSPRAAAAYDALTFEWQDTRTISHILRDLGVYKVRNRRLKGSALKSATHRALDEIVAKRPSKVDQKFEIGHRHLRIRSLRLRPI